MTAKRRQQFPAGRVACAAILLALATALTDAAEKPKIGTDVGQMHPDFRLPSLDGGYARLSDYRGKKVLLFNFASW